MHLIDNSAWARLDLASLPGDVRERVAERFATGRIAVCSPFLLEAGWSARNAADHEAVVGDLLHLPRFSIDRNVEDVAIAAQSALASRNHHRSAAPADLLIAACAHVHGLGVLHYDRDDDVLAELGGLDFESDWLAPPGSL